MSMITIIENKEYKVDELKRMFHPNYDEIMEFCFLNKISSKISNRTNSIVKFSFVGCLFLKKGAILFLPKYFKDPTTVNQTMYMKLLLQVLQKYQKNKIENPTDYEILNEEDDYLHLFGTISYLIHKYVEHGLYVKEYNEKVLYGSSEIDWQSTIDQEIAYLTRTGTPIYLDLVKEEMEYDWFAPITQIHKSILNRCTKLTQEWGIDDILDWPKIHLEVNEDWLNKPREAEYWIDKAMQSEFQDRNLLLLKNLSLFIKEINSMKFQTKYQLIGSKYFHSIWERCCSEVLQHNSKLQNEIPKPIWKSKSGVDKTRRTLKPDFLKHLKEGKMNALIIFDAKYYAIELQGHHVNNNPGVDDLTKQYMYHKALNRYIIDEKITKTYNAFLFPSLDHGEQVFGTATLDFISHLPSIFLVKINAEDFFRMYLKGHSWNAIQLIGLLEKIESY